MPIDTKEPHVVFHWNDYTGQYTAEFCTTYKLVLDKRLTRDEELTLSTYLSLVETDKPFYVSAEELWSEYHDGELPFDEENGNFLWCLQQIMSEPTE